MNEVGDDIATDEMMDTLASLFSEKVSAETDETSEIEVPEGCELFSTVFGWSPSHGDYPIQVYKEDNTPALDPHWIWPREETEEAVLALELKLPTRLVGLPGSGKSKWAEQYAAATGRGFYRIPFSESLFLDQLLGSKEIVDGDTCFVKGELPRRITSATVVLCDEVSRASAAINMGFLQRFLEPGNILTILDTGEEIHPHEGVVVMGADNSLGLGENSDKFPTSNVQDSSTQNRWACTVSIGYMPEDSLTSLIISHVPELARQQAVRLARLATLCQNAYAAGDIPLSFSPRQAIPIAKLAVRLKSVERAFKINYLNALDEDSRATVNGFFNTIW